MSLIATQLKILSENGTRGFAHALSKIATAGDIILLQGDLGAGKSFLARAFLRALANDENLEVPSPTFSLVQPYKLNGVDCLHADLYRLSDESEAEELGLFDDSAVRLIEWPDRLPELADAASICVKLQNVPHEPGQRDVTIKLDAERHKQLAAMLESSSDIITA